MSDLAFDALVIGARVAGSTLAALLGDAGHRVLLIDQASFPSPTLSTHFFRGARMVAVLDRLKVLDQVLALGPPPLRRQYVYGGGSGEPVVEPPQEPGDADFSLSVRRESFDHLLVRRAVRSGSVELLERTRATALLWEDGRVVGARLATPNGEREVRARIVVGADGRHSFVARAVAAPVEEQAPPTRAVYHQYVRDFPGPGGGQADGAEFSLLGDEVAYVFPSDDGVTCVALSVNQETFAWIRTARTERFRERLSRHAGLASRFAGAIPEGKLLGCGPEPNYVHVPVGPGWALVGDAGLHQDPWSGRGMDAAGLHATFLAEALLEWLGGGASESEALATYHARRNQEGLETYRATVALGRDLSVLTEG